jgi:PAS domain S-box-containing protein
VTELSQDAYRAALEALPTGVYLVDHDRRILLWSKGAEELTGYLAMEVVGRCCRDELLMHCDESALCLCGNACHLQQTMHDGIPRTADMFLLHKAGHRVPVRVHAVPLHDSHGATVGAIECFDRRLPFHTVEHQTVHSHHGAHLPSREAMERRLNEYLQTYETEGVPFGVLCMAVPALELVRHAKGSEAVHAVLTAAAQTLAGALGPDDAAGRWSDEGFLAVVAGCSNASLAQVANSLSCLVSSMRVRWWGDRIPVGLSVGRAIVRAGDTAETLVSRAEAALQRSLSGSEHADVD